MSTQPVITESTFKPLYPSEKQGVTQNATCLILDLKSVGSTRKVPTAHVTVDADEDLIKVSKTLLDSKELKAIKSRDGEGRTWIYNKCIASAIIRSGVYLCPIKSVEKVEKYLAKWKAEREDLVSALCKVYKTLVENDRERLRNEFEPKDYPGVRELNGELEVNPVLLGLCFSMAWSYQSFEADTRLKAVSAEFYAKEQLKAQEKWKDVTAEVQNVLRAQMLKLVSHMTDKLKPEDGKKKIFRDSMVSNMNDFLQTFLDEKNTVANDAELKSLVLKAKIVMEGVDAEALRSNDSLKEAVQKQFTAIQDKLSAMVIEAPTRSISLED